MVTASYSKVKTWARCALQYHNREVLHLPEAFAEPLAFGFAVHKLLEGYNSGHMILDAEVLREVALGELRNSAGRSTAESRPDENALHALAVEAADMAAKWWAWDGRYKGPVEVEARRSRDAHGVQFNGRLDGLADGDGIPLVVEYKTSAQAWDALEAHLETQGEFYAWLLGGPVRVRHEVLVRATKRLPVRFQVFEREISVDDIERVDREIWAFLNRQEEPIRNRGKHCRWCPFIEVCAPGATELRAAKDEA